MWGGRPKGALGRGANVLSAENARLPAVGNISEGRCTPTKFQKRTQSSVGNADFGVFSLTCTKNGGQRYTETCSDAAHLNFSKVKSDPKVTCGDSVQKVLRKIPIGRPQPLVVSGVGHMAAGIGRRIRRISRGRGGPNFVFAVCELCMWRARR